MTIRRRIKQSVPVALCTSAALVLLGDRTNGWTSAGENYSKPSTSFPSRTPPSDKGGRSTTPAWIATSTFFVAAEEDVVKENAPAGEDSTDTAVTTKKTKTCPTFDTSDFLDDKFRFTVNVENCNCFLTKVEFGLDRFNSKWMDVSRLQWFHECIYYLRTYGVQDKSTNVGGIHYPTLITNFHTQVPVSSASQNWCWQGDASKLINDPKAEGPGGPMNAEHTATAVSCCSMGEDSGCFDNVFTYKRCCLGEIKKDLPHFFSGPALDLNVANAVHHWGTFDIAQSYAMQTLIENGDFVIDVGANIGGFTIPFSEKVGKHGKVFAFEPFRLLFQHLNANIALNGLSNVWPFQLAIGEKAKKVQAFQPNLNTINYPSAMKVEEQYEGKDGNRESTRG